MNLLGCSLQKRFYNVILCIFISGMLAVSIYYNIVVYKSSVVLNRMKWVSNLMTSTLRVDHIMSTHKALFVTDISDINKFAKPEVGHLWPQRFGPESKDRMIHQISFIDKFWPKINGSSSKPLPLRPDQMKVILKYGRFNFPNFVGGQDRFINDNCPVNSCTLTGNMSQRDKADAIVMSEFGWSSRHKLLPKPKHQIWITHVRESPKHNINQMKLEALKGLVNWTATYRRDSTIPFKYEHFVSVVNATSITGINYAKGRTKQVAWLVSHCHPANHRKSYAHELSRYIDVDVYGKCGTKKCPAKGSCLEEIRRQYKFYLAFENSNCREYITEKFFQNALANDLLPVVLGAPRDDYLAIAPPKSFIHVDDFATARDLADFLHYLDKNDTAYNTYFAWKGTMVFVNQRYWCRLCTMLHLQEKVGYVHWYDDYSTWWNKGMCTAGSVRLLSSNLLKLSFAYTLVAILLL